MMQTFYHVSNSIICLLIIFITCLLIVSCAIASKYALKSQYYEICYAYTV